MSTRKTDWFEVTVAICAPMVAAVILAGIIVNVFPAKPSSVKREPPPEDSVPPITEFMQRQIDRQMIRDIWTYVQDQKAFRAQFDADLKDGKIPHLPGVK